MNFPSNHRPHLSYLTFCLYTPVSHQSMIINILGGNFYMSSSFQLTLDSLRQKLSFSCPQVPRIPQVTVAQYTCGTA